MVVDETKAGLQRVLDALTAPESDHAAAPSATSASADAVTLWYQPKIDVKQRCLAGAEAFARIGDAAPAADLSEDDMARLTEQALLTALRDWTVFDAAGFNLCLAINVPVVLLDRLPIAAIVGDNRPKADHWPGLIIEVAEDQIARDIKRIQEIAAKLRVSGVKVAIDDFGAGYSSFASLREITFAELKINASFVTGCAGDSTSGAICQTAIDLAHRFGSAAVAEGIETVADFQAMQIMGCDFAQGRLIAPAMARDDFLALLQQRMNKSRGAGAETAAASPAAPADDAQAPPAAASA
jgi:EAL domain-containing protein (putative c-di-GMP-specific phosphodiesterase class I)